MTKEEKKEYDRQYYEAHKEDRREYNHNWYEANKEKRKEQQRQYRNSPRGRAIHMVKRFKREDRKRGRGECTITPEWIEENIFNSKCIYCGETDWRLLGCDRIDNDLPHTPENVVCSCTSCNRKRGTVPFKVFIQRLKKGEPLLQKNRPDLSKPVFAKDKDGNIVCWFPSTKEAERNGYNQSAVSDCCRGKLKTYKGLYWQYE